MRQKTTEIPLGSEIVIYRIAKLFGTQRPAITKHLHNIFATGELK